MSSIIIEYGDLTNQKVECIVNDALPSLAKGEGLCKMIFEKAGEKELSDSLKSFAHLLPGEVILTPGFALSPYIIHAIGPYEKEDDEALIHAYQRSLSLAKENQIHTIAFPLLFTGVLNYPIFKAWRQAITVCLDFMEENKDYDLTIYIINNHREMAAEGENILETLWNRRKVN